MNEVFCFRNTQYRFVGILTHLGAPYYVVERIDEEVCNFLYIIRDEKNKRQKLEYAPPEIIADLVDQLFHMQEE